VSGRTEFSLLPRATKHADHGWTGQVIVSTPFAERSDPCEPSIMRPRFGRDRDSTPSADCPPGPMTARQETLSSADSGVGDQLVETVLLDFQVERALGDPELFGHKVRIAANATIAALMASRSTPSRSMTIGGDGGVLACSCAPSSKEVKSRGNPRQSRLLLPPSGPPPRRHCAIP